MLGHGPRGEGGRPLSRDADAPAAFAENPLFIRVVTQDGRALARVRLNENACSLQFRETSSHIHSVFKPALRELHKNHYAPCRPTAACVYQIRESANKLACSRLVIDGILSVTERPNIVTALGGRTGRALWTYRRPLPTDVQSCCGPGNRGLAALGDTPATSPPTTAT